jgi:hypothetical protein
VSRIVETSGASYDQAPRNEDLVFLADDRAWGPPAEGCDQIVAFDLDSATTVYTGPQRISPGRMTSNRDLTTVLSVNGTMGSKPNFIYKLDRSQRFRDDWRTTIITSGAVTDSKDLFTQWGDIALLPDGDSFLVSLGDNQFGNGNPSEGGVARFHLSDVAAGAVGRVRAAAQLSGFAVRLLVTSDGQTVHVLESSATGDSVRTLSAIDLTEVAQAIGIARITASPLPFAGDLYHKHASLSLDERYVVTNRWRAHSLNIVDLVGRTSRVVALDAEYVGEPEFNRGWVNRGLLAVHLRDAVVVLEPNPAGNFDERGRIAIPPSGQEPDTRSGPWPSLAWSTSGDRIIAGSFDPDLTTEFVVIRVEDGGRVLAVEEAIDVCKGIQVDPGESGFDGRPMTVHTGNGLIAPPQPAPTGTVPPTPTPTAETPTPTRTHTGSPTPRSTPSLGSCVCAHVTRWVPAAAVAVALSNPDQVLGWMEPRNPSLPPGPNNPPRMCLSLRNRATRYHPLYNPLIYASGCG